MRYLFKQLNDWVNCAEIDKFCARLLIHHAEFVNHLGCSTATEAATAATALDQLLQILETEQETARDERAKL